MRSNLRNDNATGGIEMTIDEGRRNQATADIERIRNHSTRPKQKGPAINRASCDARL